jgi:hypothetical protein
MESVLRVYMLGCGLTKGLKLMAYLAFDLEALASFPGGHSGFLV